MRRTLALAAVALSLIAAAPQTTLGDIEDEVMCDVCNVALNIAESPRADQQRQEIRDLIAEGKTKQEVLDTLEDRYGPQILALPPQRGFSAAAYVVPIAVVAVLVVALVLLLPRWRRRPVAATPGGAPAVPPALSDADARRLDEDLARYGG